MNSSSTKNKAIFQSMSVLLFKKEQIMLGPVKVTVS